MVAEIFVQLCGSDVLGTEAGRTLLFLLVINAQVSYGYFNPTMFLYLF